ncbi:MAG: hypothetical protein AB1576_09325 [Bacillota bacterium]
MQRRFKGDFWKDREAGAWAGRHLLPCGTATTGPGLFIIPSSETGSKQERSRHLAFSKGV